MHLVLENPSEIVQIGWPRNRVGSRNLRLIRSWCKNTWTTFHDKLLLTLYSHACSENRRLKWGKCSLWGSRWKPTILQVKGVKVRRWADCANHSKLNVYLGMGWRLGNFKFAIVLYIFLYELVSPCCEPIWNISNRLVGTKIRAHRMRLIERLALTWFVGDIREESLVVFLSQIPWLINWGIICFRSNRLYIGRRRCKRIKFTWCDLNLQFNWLGFRLGWKMLVLDPFIRLKWMNSLCSEATQHWCRVRAFWIILISLLLSCRSFWH